MKIYSNLNSKWFMQSYYEWQKKSCQFYGNELVMQRKVNLYSNAK